MVRHMCFDKALEKEELRSQAEEQRWARWRSGVQEVLCRRQSRQQLLPKPIIH